MDGFKATAVCCMSGPRTKDKGIKTAEAIFKRTRNIFKVMKLPDFTRTNIQIVGAEDTYGPRARYSGM